jgi:hypothetical protein
MDLQMWKAHLSELYHNAKSNVLDVNEPFTSIYLLSSSEK